MLEKIAAQLCMSTIELGPGLLLAVIMLIGLFKLIKGIGLKIVAALEEPAKALTMQAKSMDRLTSSLEVFVGRDQTEHREIIILLKVIAGRLDHLKGKERDRGSVLKLLAYQHPAPLEMKEIHSLLDHLRLTITDEEMRSHVCYLKEKGFLTVEERKAGGLQVEMVRITAVGLDVLDRFREDVGVSVEF
jgi:hypothetical protein